MKRLLSLKATWMKHRDAWPRKGPRIVDLLLRIAYCFNSENGVERYASFYRREFAVLHAWILGGVSVVLFIAANGLAKEFGQSGSWLFAVLMCIAAVGGFFAFAPVAAKRGVAVMAVVIDVSVALGSVFLGLFKEERITPIQAIGIIMALCGVSLVLYFAEEE